MALILLPVRHVREPEWGVTFHKGYAQSLGLDWKKTYTDMLGDLGVHRVRLSVAWSAIEPSPGVFQFADEDWMLKEAGARGAEVILAIGRKTPRWPECDLPAWYPDSPDAQKQAVLQMLASATEHFASFPSVVSWQVENEPFLPFGDCKPFPLDFYRQEVATVRAKDSRPISTTSSGELEPYLHLSFFVDRVGFSLYRVVYRPITGFFVYPFPPLFYQMRVMLLRSFRTEPYVSELQTEPWFPKPMALIPVEQQLRLFSPRMFEDNIRFARRVGVDVVDLWGVEWWAFLRAQGHPQMWNIAKELFGG